MKKFFSMMMAFAAVFALTACGEDTPGGDNPGGNGGGNNGAKLATPELSETHTETSITVSWGAIENAEVYVVNFNQKSYTTDQLTYTFENVNAGTYNIRVVARADGYKDSEPAKITVTVTGATEVDWFTQTVSLPAAEGETVDNGEGQVVTYMPYNAIKVLWKGTEVDEIKYGLFVTENLAGATDVQIMGNLIAPSDVVALLELINSEDGLEMVYGGCTGSTSYTACVWVKNKAGQEFFAKNEITTEGFDVPAETQAWVGSWNAKTSQVISIDSNGKGVLSDKEDSFTLTISASTVAPDMVDIDGLSIFGDGNRTVGYVMDNTLTIVTNFSLGTDDKGITYMWLPYVAVDGQLLGLNDFGGEVPAHTLTMAEDGTVTGETGKFGVRFEDGTEAEAEVVCTELYGVDQQGKLYFFIESFPAVFRAGALELTKAATPTAKVLNKEAKNYPMTLSSLVL